MTTTRPEDYGDVMNRSGNLGGEWATLAWIDWFNNRRLLEPIGNIPPAEAEANYYLQSAESAVAA